MKPIVPLLLTVLAGAGIAGQNQYLPPTFFATTLSNGNVGSNYSANIVMFRNSTVPTVIMLVPTNLPPGLTLGSSYQRNPPGAATSTVFPITGKPTQAGAYAVKFEAWEDCISTGTGLIPLCGSHLAGFSSTSVYTTSTIIIGASLNGPPAPEPLQITTTALPSASYGTSYQAALNATGGNGGSLQWSAQGNLPPVLALTAAGLTTQPSELISGCPSTVGNYRFSITVSQGGSTSANRAFTLPVAAGTPPITLQPQSWPGGQVGQTYPSLQLHASLGCLSNSNLAPVFGAVPFTLPPGMEISTAGLVSGIPTQSGSFTVKVLVAAGTNGNATVPVALTIKPAPSLTVSLLDPVPLKGSTSLLSGPYVASTSATLSAANARSVKGVTADGFSQLVVSIPTDKAGRHRWTPILSPHKKGSPCPVEVDLVILPLAWRQPMRGLRTRCVGPRSLRPQRTRW